ncbi:MAG: MarR family transcriptional regulator [Nitrospirae bacterium]|nr:MarR family transcriptional regulator [Nitrospirota bacterium]
MKQVIDGTVLYRALSDLARRYQFRNRDEVCCYGLTVSQCYALQALSEKGVLASSELASGLGLDLSTTTRLVDQLVRKKLVVRHRGIKDARIREIEITEAGHRLVNRIETDLSRLLAQAVSHLPPAVQKSLPEAIRCLATALVCRTSVESGVPVKEVGEAIKA